MTALITRGAVSIQQRALRAVANLVLREAAVRLLNVVVAVLLARLLGPAVLGEFALASFAVGIVGLLGDLGLGAALMRQHGALSDADLRAAASLQLMWTALLALGAIAAAPALAELLGGACPPELIQVLTLTVVARSLRLVPAALAERQLAYGRIAVAETVDQALYALIAVALAIAGYGAWSFIVASVLGAAAGTVALLAVTGWRPTWQWDVRPVFSHLRFGVAFQGQTVLHFIKDTIVPSIGGRAYGSAAVGYLSWAHQFAALPLVLTHLVSRVGFPALSQLQDDQRALFATLEGMLRWTARLSFPAFAVLAGLAPEMTHYVFGPQWLPATPALRWYSLNMLLGVGTGILLPALYVTGHTVAGLRISAGWTALTVACSFGLVRAGVGFTGLAAAQTIGTAAALAFVVLELRRIGTLDIVAAVRVPTITAVLAVGALRLAASAWVLTPWSLCVLATLAASAALVFNLLEERRQLHTLLTYWKPRHLASAGFASTSAIGPVHMGPPAEAGRVMSDVR